MISIVGCRQPKANSKNANRNDSVILSDALLSKLDKLIEVDSAKSNHRLFVIRFAVLDNNSYVIMYKTYFYRKEYVDGYFFRNKQLVVFYNIDKLNSTGILNEKYMYVFKDSIPQYFDMSKCDMQFEVYPKKFKIVSPDSLRIIVEDDSIFRKL